MPMFRPVTHRLGSVALLAALAGCGGGSAPSGEALATGVLSDSPVEGVQYLRNGVAAGSTDILGQFRYKADESLEFRIGALSLGTVTGTGSAMTVTPLQLVQGLSLTEAARAHRVTNLLVLLQSLDDDGDPDNGIRIPAAAIAALDTAAEAATLDLAADPAVFFADTDLDAIITAINAVDPTPLAAKPASVAAALDHFKTQFLSSLAGSWLGSIDNNAAAFRFRNDGNYLMGEVGVASGGGTSGLELGSIDWDPASGFVTVATPVPDTNGGWGLSYISAVALPNRVQLTLDGDELVVTERNADTGAEGPSFRIPRHYDSASALTGTWAKDSAYALTALHLFMRSDGLVMAVNPAADKSLLGRTASGCAQPGVEFGNYSQGTGFLIFSGISLYDTDGCGGLHDANLAPDYLGNNLHVSPVLSGTNYAVSMGWSWNTTAGTQAATLYRASNSVPPP